MSNSARDRQDGAALFVLSAVTLALMTILSVWKLKQFKYRLINEAGGAMFYGKQPQARLRPGQKARKLLRRNTSSTHSSLFFQGVFESEVLFNLFLPPIIFFGAYTLNQRRFLNNLGSVLTYAFLGTMISCLCIGACVYGFTRLMVLLGRAADGEFSLTDCLLFGAIMSATDPVSVLGLLSDLRVDSDLHTLLFGESVLNDAVAIVLTHAIASYDQMGTGNVFDPPAFLRSVGFFLGVLIGSFLLGFIFTVITNPLLETSIFFLLSWSSFLSAEACGLSGIVAVLFCGLSQAKYTTLNLSHEGKTRTKQLFEVLKFLGEIFIFGYMGYIWFTFRHHDFRALFIFGAFLSIFISRACNVYPLSFLLNLGRTSKISHSSQHFMLFAGLRGAISFSLAVRDTSTEAKRTILTTCLLLIGFTVWVLGAAAGPLLGCLDLRLVFPDKLNMSQNKCPVSTNETRGDRSPSVRIWPESSRYLTPLLTHCGPPLTESLPQWCGRFTGVFCGHQKQKDSNVNMERSELSSARGSDSGSEHQEDLLEGDLGLGTAAAHVIEEGNPPL
uniref:Sodium/hydrogen exchanger n=1 Tax=Fundulus heteroclitus TaxID=8078 RepID=A0A3Q2TH92_FUNHE